MNAVSPEFRQPRERTAIVGGRIGYLDFNKRISDAELNEEISLGRGFVCQICSSSVLTPSGTGTQPCVLFIQMKRSGRSQRVSSRVPGLMEATSGADFRTYDRCARRLWDRTRP